MGDACDRHDMGADAVWNTSSPCDVCDFFYLFLFFMLCVGGQVSVKSVLFSPAGWIRSLQICTACYCNSSHGRCSRCSSLQRWVCKGEVSMGASLLCSGIQGALIHYSTSTSFPVSLSSLHSHAHTCMHTQHERFECTVCLSAPGQYCPPVYVSWHKSWPLPYPCDSLHKGGSVVTPQSQKIWLALPAPCCVTLGRLFNHWVHFFP